MLKMHLQPPGQAGHHGLFAIADGLKHRLEFSVQFGESSRCPLDKGQNPTLPLSDRRAGPHRAGAGDGEWAKPLRSPCQHWSSLTTPPLNPPHSSRRSRMVLVKSVDQTPILCWSTLVKFKLHHCRLTYPWGRTRRWTGPLSRCQHEPSETASAPL